MKLGKLEQITDLRSIWKHEANDFTPWLAKEENLAALSDAIGIWKIQCKLPPKTKRFCPLVLK